MGMNVKEFDFPSASGLSDIYARAFIDETVKQPKAVIQICHGMAEHSDRYIPFIEHLTSAGYVVFIHDHLGHGKSIANEEELGFFGNKFGWHDLVNDAKLLTDFAKANYESLPYIIFGHSMGSFVARSYIEKYGANVDAAILCGTSGANPAAGLGAIAASIVGKKNGSHYRSNLLQRLAFGKYNQRIKTPRTEFDWLTRDEVIVDQYIEDPLCGFVFTSAGFHDLFKLLQSVSKHEWYQNIPFVLPILLISGLEDPVGEYGKGVRQVYNDLKKTGHNEVTMKLYENDRHELLNELDKAQVFSDITTWINEILDIATSKKGES